MLCGPGKKAFTLNSLIFAKGNAINIISMLCTIFFSSINQFKLRPVVGSE